jgi:drug/metabolite transporter (DMT)-like permease
VTLALGAVLVSAACAGTANILQARAARRVAPSAGLRPDLLVRLLGSTGYRAALVLIATGMLLAIYALRVLPVFLVQAGRAASLGITAVLSIWMLGIRPRRYEVAAVAAVAVGLVVLAWSTGPQVAPPVADAPRLVLLGLLAAVALAAWWVSRAGVRAADSGLALAVAAGLSYAVLAVAARLLRGLAPATLVTDPAAWTMALAGALGLLLTATALQRASAVSATAAIVGSETLVAALLGVLLCGDRPAPGSTAYAVAGFVAITSGALTLARFGGPLEAPQARAVARRPDLDAGG